MKSNLKSVLVTMIVVSLLFNIGTVYADETKDAGTSGIFSGVLSKATAEIGALLIDVVKGITNNPIITGVIGAGVSAYMTYDSLSDLSINKSMHVDRVNISDREEDYFNKKSKEKLAINPEKEMILTDRNVLDVDFIVTVKDLTTYKDLSKNPNMRLAERTELIKVLDANNQPVAGQKRGVLFEDAESTIKQAYEYRTLLIKYKEAKYNKQPVKLEIGTGDILSWGWLIQFFSTGEKAAKSEIDDRIFNYDITEEQYPKIPVEKVQKFRLLFNSRVDENAEPIDSTLLDCTTEGGMILGTTGTEVLPKVAYNWDFKENKIVTPITGEGTEVKNSEWCDVANNGIYCDATQLSIEVLQKINKINEIVRTNNASFTCPTPVTEQALVSDVNNVGITYINIEKISSSRLNFTYKVRGNYQLSMPVSDSRSLFDIDYEVTKKAENSFNWEKIASGKVSVPVSYLNTGDYLDEIEIDKFSQEPTDTDIIEIKLTLTNFHEAIAHNETGNNLIDNILTTQTNITGGTMGCSLPKTSENLNKYYPGFDEKLYNFRAYLMKDGYSEDFKKDFDDYYRSTFLKDTPQWYGSSEILTTQSNYTPLYKYFTDKDKFKFVLMNSGSVTNQTLSGPGRYDVKIIIHYDDSWRLFNDAGNMTGKIEVVISKEQNPEIDYPLYYMPLDGLVGSTGDKTRNGYGVDYLNDKVPIYLDSQNNYSGTMFTEGYVSSNTVSTIDTKEVKDFAIMNNGNERGKLLSINREQNNLLKLRYIPSRPTPVVMKVKNTAVNTNAWAFYKLALGLPLGQGGEVASPGLSLAYWTGFANCKDFTGVPLLERFLATGDLVSTESKLAPVTQSQTFSYGIEWEKDIIVRTGNVWMYTIFYTPSNFRTGKSTSYLHKDVANDSLKFYTLDNLAGSNDYVELTNRFNHDIVSITDVFDLVTQKKACVNYDNKSFEVFYNPKEISQELTDTINSKIEATPGNTGDEFSCIKN